MVMFVLVLICMLLIELLFMCMLVLFVLVLMCMLLSELLFVYVV